MTRHIALVALCAALGHFVANPGPATWLLVLVAVLTLFWVLESNA